MKFTEEELSRILSAHDNGQLRVGGASDWHLLIEPLEYCGKGCVNQMAYNEPGILKSATYNIIAADWFDDNYDRKWTSEYFLSRLEKEGLA